MIDLHSHVLPGLDDGTESLEDALALCEAAARDGITVLAATPHVRAHDYPTTPGQMEAALATLRAAGPALEVVPGGELDLAELDRPQEELRRFGLGGRPDTLLVETPYLGWPLDLAERLFRLRVQGFRVVLAHPERNGDVQERPELLEPIVQGGALVQLTAASVDGRLGANARRCSRTLLERGLVHLLASDAHAPSVRAVGLRAAVQEVGEELGRWLTVDVPRALLEGGEPPPRPVVRARRRSLFRRR
ncbi:MAG TPA: CpsB/CapC family capsule biosynthesis tyrosine phosphatase [Gaiellaceae bacterium]|nr:CpsB/CapC family capsule biosynthesis tyrosine phosphatase [Gaiellaceae bacterium]